jgi:transcriptional regulator with XRE-family HTH domain
VNTRDVQYLEKLALRIKQLRKQKNMTQEMLAYSSGLELSQIARIETARRNPTICTLKLIAVGLEIELKTLLDF